MTVYEALVLLATVEACVIALGIAVFGFWLRRRLDAHQRRDQRAWGGLRRIARALGVRLVDFEQSVFEENGLTPAERHELADTFKETRAGLPDEGTLRLANRTPPGAKPPKDPDDG